MNDTTPILSVKDIRRRFPMEQRLLGKSRHFVHAVNGVSFDLYPGRTVGLVGESGCGKSTVGKIICKLDQPDDGSIFFHDEDIASFGKAEAMNYHRNVQMIFQNPYTSLNPRQKIGRMLREVYQVHKICEPAEIENQISEMLGLVGLPEDSKPRYPFEFSGGQRQRICIARSLSVRPQVVVCDEPVSALDVSIQAQVLHLLKDLQTKFNLAYLFISHDLSVVYHVCDEVLVMYRGKVVERGPVEQIFKNPGHPYTRALLSAIPRPDPSNKSTPVILKGEMPSPTDLPQGCPFYSRCPERLEKCAENPPPLRELPQNHQASCWLEPAENPASWTPA